jgi:hypothetical protein
MYFAVRARYMKRRKLRFDVPRWRSEIHEKKEIPKRCTSEPERYVSEEDRSSSTAGSTSNTVQLRLLAPRVAAQQRKEAKVQASFLCCVSACRARTVGSAFLCPVPGASPSSRCTKKEGSPSAGFLPFSRQRLSGLSKRLSLFCYAYNISMYDEIKSMVISMFMVLNTFGCLSSGISFCRQSEFVIWFIK